MRTYRLPTSILWNNGGWRVFEAADAEDAMFVYRENYPLSAGHVGLPNLQVLLGDGWRWASDVPVHLGGYDRGRTSS